MLEEVELLATLEVLVSQLDSFILLPAEHRALYKYFFCRNVVLNVLDSLQVLLISEVRSCFRRSLEA